MKTPDPFKTTISNYLNTIADKDPAFAETLKKPAKNIDDCATYIMNAVKAKYKGQQAVAVSDEEVFGMAIHYYDEDNIEVGKPVKANVAAPAAAASAVAKPIKKTLQKPVTDNQPSLF